MENWELIIAIGTYIFLLIMSFLIGREVGQIQQLKRCMKDLDILIGMLTNKQEG
jgi:low affinity Fe/Cu permease